MSEVHDMIERAKEIRNRLRRPPNAVKDTGIDLKRGKPFNIKDLSEKMVKEYPRFSAIVHIVSKAPFSRYPDKKISMNAIFHVVANKYGISVEKLLGKTRGHRTIKARFITYYLCRKYAPHNSYLAIGLKVKHNHTSIIYGKNNIEERMLVDPDLCEEIIALEEALFGGDYDHYDERNNHRDATLAPIGQPNLACQKRREGKTERGIQGVDGGGGVGAKEADYYERLQENCWPV